MSSVIACLADTTVDQLVPVDKALTGEGQEMVIDYEVVNARMAGWRQTQVAISEKIPNASLGCYIQDKSQLIDYYLLTKIVVGVEGENGIEWTGADAAAQVDDVPGGVVARYRIGGVKVQTQIDTLPVDADVSNWRGGCLFKVSTEPAVPVVLKCGGSLVSRFAMRKDWMLQSEVGKPCDQAQVCDLSLALLTSQLHPLNTAVCAEGKMKVAAGDEGGQILSIAFPNGGGRLVLAFSDEQQEAIRIAQSNPDKALAQLEAHYTKLLASRVQTPDPNINEAFRRALIELEYTWLPPLGWVECLQHWPALWHMQYAGAADWLGQADRSALCLLTHAQKILPDGSIPQLNVDGQPRDDWGGSTQWYFWQVRQYWRDTADKQTILKALPVLDRALERVYEKYDPDKDGLISWGLQLGNQEDFVTHPFQASGPSIEAINMLHTRAMIAEEVEGKDPSPWLERARQTRQRLHDVLWMPELGRFAYYADPNGIKHLEAPYQAYVYPAIYGITDELDQWSSLLHARRHLTGTRGELYCSNTFPNHINFTWGSQPGLAQQPWAAWALASAGLRNEAWRPLKYVADLVMNEHHRGSWPETSTEPAAAYFSTPAALWIQSLVEAVYGLRLDSPTQTLHLSPCFPDAWPRASLELPGFSVRYQRKANRYEYCVSSLQPLRREIEWSLAPGRVVALTCDGKPLPYTLRGGVDCVILEATLEPMQTSRLVLDYEPASYALHVPASIAQGETLEVQAQGVKIKRVDDRCGVLETQRVSGDRLEGKIKEGLLDATAGYGALGQLIFSQRVIFLECETPDRCSFWRPVELTILPRYEAAWPQPPALCDGQWKMPLRLRNNTFAPLSGEASVQIGGQSTPPFKVEIAPRQEADVSVTLSNEMVRTLSPGLNAFEVTLPGGESIASAWKVFSDSELFAQSEKHFRAIPIPESLLTSSAKWHDLRSWYNQPHAPWTTLEGDLMEGLERPPLRVPGYDGLEFDFQPGRFLALSSASGEQAEIPLNGQAYKKLYLLLISLADNHDMFAPFARVQPETVDGHVKTETLYIPGDLDWFYPHYTQTHPALRSYGTARRDRSHAVDLLPLLTSEEGAWDQARPPSFPQPERWARFSAVYAPHCVMNLVEMETQDLTQPLQTLRVSILNKNTAAAVVGLCGELENSQ